MLHAVARRPGDVGDDGDVFLSERVEKTRLPDVGASDEGHRDAFAQHLAAPGVLQEIRQAVPNSLESLGEIRKEGGIEFLLGKVQNGLDIGAHVVELASDLSDGPGKVPGKRALRGLGRGFACRVDQVRHRFGLGKVDASVQEGALRKFAGTGEPHAAESAFLQHRTQNHAQKNRSAVNLQFKHALSRVARGSGEEQNDRMIKHAVVLIPNGIEMCMAGPNDLVAEKGVQNGLVPTLGKRKAYDADRSATGGRCSGYNRILIAVHVRVLC